MPAKIPPFNTLQAMRPKFMSGRQDGPDSKLVGAHSDNKQSQNDEPESWKFISHYCTNNYQSFYTARTPPRPHQSYTMEVLKSSSHI
jgi:hypothetical protein